MYKLTEKQAQTAAKVLRAELNHISTQIAYRKRSGRRSCAEQEALYGAINEILDVLGGRLR